MPRVELWHHPSCSKSLAVLQLIRQAGIEPVIRDYRQEPPDRAHLREAIAAAGLGVREALRSTERDYAALGLDDAALDDDALLDAMVAAPRLINRPFVFSPLGVRLCRPPEVVLEILPAPADQQASEGGR
ncbi:MAG: arsenate reductase (glutaredoxin) [Pseudomonadota bacterium]